MTGHVLFWGWNLLLFAVLWFGLGPVVLLDLLVAVGVGMVPWIYAAVGLVLLVIPVAAMGVGFRYFRHDPGRLLSMFYGVQAPLMILALVRLFAIQQLGLSTGLALTVAVIGMAGLLRTLIAGPREAVPGLQILRLIAQAGYLVVGLWVGAMVALYAVPITARVLVDVVTHFDLLGILREVARAPQVVVGMAFGLVTMAVVAALPLAMVGLSVRSWQLVHRATAERLGSGAAGAITAATVIAVPLGLLLAAGQPQHRAFETLTTIDSDADRRAALTESPAIRRGLVEAFLASERWVEADPQGEHVLELWGYAIGQSAAVGPQIAWVALMRPFLYRPVEEGRAWGGLRGVAPADSARAETLYGGFFDEPLRRAERDELIAAARQTWRWQDAEAGLLDAGERKVRLERQTIDVDAEGDWARITIHDVVRNQTWRQQEVFLTFSLPEAAAVTGLWLGESDDRSEAFPFVVAPRGAAQEVYKAQVRRRVDPALLEQVGPRQYRLRAFPVPPRQGRMDDVSSITSEGPPFHWWIELVVPRVTEGPEAHWPLPVVSEVRNLYWDDGREHWVPRTLPAPAGALGSHRAVVGDLEVSAVPAADITGALPDRLRVLVDGTRSMDAHRSELATALADLRSRTAVEVWCTREARVQRCSDFEPADALFWGSTSLESQLTDAIGAWPEDPVPVVVLTDAGSYELASIDGEPPALGDWRHGPLWLVHLGGVLPAAMPDGTLDALSRSRGGVVASIDELTTRLSDPAVRDGFRWSVREAAGEAEGGGWFRAAAARAAIRALDAEQADGSLAHLDRVHAVAVGEHVVTAYSSMLVLVNDQQRRALAEAERDDDRFEREVETGSSASLITSTPEPTTWLLLALGGGLLAAGSRRRSGDAA